MMMLMKVARRMCASSWMIHTCMAYRCYYQEEFWRGRPLSEPDQTAIAGLERHPSRHRPATERHGRSLARRLIKRFRFGNRSIKTYSVNKGEIKSPFYNNSLVGLQIYNPPVPCERAPSLL
jgi:hypothetical protein